MENNLELLIKYIIKEQLLEIDLKTVNPSIKGLYAYIIAYNRLISIPTERGGIQNAPPMYFVANEKMPINKSPKIIMRFSGNAYEVYVNPNAQLTESDLLNEGHDLLHALTVNLAKHFAAFKEPQAVVDDPFFAGLNSPSKFNKEIYPKIIFKKLFDSYKRVFKTDIAKDSQLVDFPVSLSDKTDNLIQKLITLKEKLPQDKSEFLNNFLSKLKTFQKHHFAGTYDLSDVDIDNRGNIKNWSMFGRKRLDGLGALPQHHGEETIGNSLTSGRSPSREGITYMLPKNIIKAVPITDDEIQSMKQLATNTREQGKQYNEQIFQRWIDYLFGSESKIGVMQALKTEFNNALGKLGSAFNG